MKSRRSSVTKFESLENRSLMSTVTVTSLADSGAGTLRAAIDGSSAGDTIQFGNLAGTITLQSQILLSNKDFSLVGSGRSSLTINAAGLDRAFSGTTTGTVSISDLTIVGSANGANQGGAIYMHGQSGSGSLNLARVDIRDSHGHEGGGVYLDEITPTIDACNFFNNHATDSSDTTAGALYINGGLPASITNSSFYNNTLTLSGTTNSAYGGAVYVSSANTTITNCTFVDNHIETTGSSGYTYIYGSGLYLYGNGTLTNNTFTGNTSDNGALTNYGDGAAASIELSGNITLHNNLIAGNDNVETDDLSIDLNGESVTSDHNLIGDGTNSLLTDGQNGNIVGTTANPIVAELGTLANNGGGTKTVAIAATSPAVNAGGNSAPSTDQRGVARENAPDIGAYEYTTPTTPTFTRLPRATVAVNGKTAALSASVISPVSGPITYQWALLDKPNHAANAVFANAASRNTTLTFKKAGTYTLRITGTASDNQTITRHLTVVVNQVASLLRIIQHKQTLSSTLPTKMRAVLIDQFGDRMAQQPAFTWALEQGAGSINAGTGLYTPAGDDYSFLLFRASAGSLTGVAGNRLKPAA